MLFFLSSVKDDKKWEKIWYRTLVHTPRELYPVMVIFAGWTRGFPGWGYKYTKSDIFGIEYVCAGNAILFQDGKEYLVNKGEVFLIRRNVYHRYIVGPAGYLLKRFVIIDGIDIENTLRYLNLWDKDHIVIKEPKRFEKLLKRFMEIPSEPIDQYTLGIKMSSLAFQTLLVLSQSIRHKYPPVIEKALEFMNSNLDKSLSREDICAHVGMSRQNFNRIFSSHMHCSPINYFLKQKIGLAANLLKTTSLSVKEIAFTLGYENPFYFSNQFKQHYGISPATYRASRDFGEE